jgi:hypothetical protein
MEMATAKFEVLHDGFSHEGKWYPRGEIVELDKDHGERLAREFGALRADGSKPASSGGSEPERVEESSEGSETAESEGTPAKSSSRSKTAQAKA